MCIRDRITRLQQSSPFSEERQRALRNPRPPWRNGRARNAILTRSQHNPFEIIPRSCLLYTSDAADDM
eukprot:14337056-Alexandrium_andersonii.AAC.1